jgi:hypothetical protein
MTLESDHQRRQSAAEELYRHARQALRDGERDRAKALLLRAVDHDRGHSEAWLWLSATTDDPIEQRHYLEWALAANPGNAAARRGLGVLTGRMRATPPPAPPQREVPMERGEASPPAPLPDAKDSGRRDTRLEKGRGADKSPVANHQLPITPSSAAETFTCPQCGAALAFRPAESALGCGHCGYARPVEARPAAEAEELLDFTLPTARGQRWAVGERLFACGQCGARTLLPPGTASTTCAFCGANALVAASEDPGLIAPHAVIPMRLAAEAAAEALGAWLKQGFLVPGDLAQLSRGRRLRPVYVPCWVFSAVLTAHWRARVAREGFRGGQSSEWLSGEHPMLFNRHLEPAVTWLPARLVRAAGPFALDQRAAFEPAFLAGWPASLYDVSLAQASLRAREAMMATARRRLPARVAAGQTVSDFVLTRGDFSGVSFQLALLPVWIGAYTYGNRTYQVVVNGQTGRVAGARPTDWIKLVLIVLAVLAAVTPLVVWLVVRGFVPRP